MKAYTRDELIRIGARELQRRRFGPVAVASAFRELRARHADEYQELLKTAKADLYGRGVDLASSSADHCFHMGEKLVFLRRRYALRKRVRAGKMTQSEYESKLYNVDQPW